MSRMIPYLALHKVEQPIPCGERLEVVVCSLRRANFIQPRGVTVPP